MNDLITCSVCGEAHNLAASELTFCLPDQSMRFRKPSEWRGAISATTSARVIGSASSFEDCRRSA